MRQESYTYQYVNARPGLGAVTGFRYEQLGDPSTAMFAYAKYTLLTDYFYLPLQQSTSQFEAGNTTSQASIGYRYNNNGWLAAKIMQGSDNSVIRTRYKYLSDYPLPVAGATGELLAMNTRVGEGISSDPVETISEVRPTGVTGHVAYAGAMLQSFTTSTVPDANNIPGITPTYPYQLRRWQPAQAVANYDSVRIDGTTLHVPAALRVASTVLSVDPNLTPVSVRTEAGRQIAGKHLGYSGMVPLLQIANAPANEVIFSDFETTDKPFRFGGASNSSTIPPNSSVAAARTGQMGYVLPAGTSLTTMLPASTAPQYRLIYWARSAAATTSTVTLKYGQNTAFTTSPPLSHPGSNQWQRYEVLLPLAGLMNRTSYQLAITAGTANGSVDLQVDDVLLLPADASASSTTYTLATGKTSETDARGRTAYYEYAPTGDLALVRDHNQAIVHQYQKALPGQTVLSGISFTTSGTMLDGTTVAFTAVASLSGPLQYKWDCGDGTITNYATTTQLSHAYPSLGYGQSYNVRLYVSSQGVEYMVTGQISLSEQPLVLTTCTAGVVSINDCNHAATVNTGCNPSAPNPGSSTTFQVTANRSSGVVYQWEWDYNNSWQDLPSVAITAGSTTSATITVARTSVYNYRCRVSHGVQEVVTEELSIGHYKSDLNCP